MRRRPVVLLSGLVLLLFACRGGEGLVGEAEWIWAPVPKRAVGATSFYAVRDFRLGEVPAAAVLRVMADEEYVAYLNGHRVGSNRYRDAAPLDEYAVGEMLQPGGNRLLVELRSGRGYGGLLAALLDDEGEPLVESDADWRIVRRHRVGLVEGRALLGDGEGAFSWGPPPTGRWGAPRRSARRPTAEAAELSCAGRPGRRRDSPTGSVVFTWDPPATGYLSLSRDAAVAAASETSTGALFVARGDGPGAAADPLTDPAAQPLLFMPRQATWTDVVPRRVSQMTVAGLGDRITAQVLALSPAAVSSLPAPAPGEREAPGLLGLEPPPRPTTTQSEVRRRLRREKDAGGGG